MQQSILRVVFVFVVGLAAGFFIGRWSAPGTWAPAPPDATAGRRPAAPQPTAIEPQAASPVPETTGAGGSAPGEPPSAVEPEPGDPVQEPAQSPTPGQDQGPPG